MSATPKTKRTRTTRSKSATRKVVARPMKAVKRRLKGKSNPGKGNPSAIATQVKPKGMTLQQVEKKYYAPVSNKTFLKSIKRNYEKVKHWTHKHRAAIGLAIGTSAAAAAGIAAAGYAAAAQFGAFAGAELGGAANLAVGFEDAAAAAEYHAANALVADANLSELIAATESGAAEIDNFNILGAGLAERGGETAAADSVYAGRQFNRAGRGVRTILSTDKAGNFVDLNLLS